MYIYIYVYSYIEVLLHLVVNIHCITFTLYYLIIVDAITRPVTTSDSTITASHSTSSLNDSTDISEEHQVQY